MIDEECSGKVSIVVVSGRCNNGPLNVCLMQAREWDHGAFSVFGLLWETNLLYTMPRGQVLDSNARFNSDLGTSILNEMNLSSYDMLCGRI